MSDPLQDLAEELRELSGQLQKVTGELRELSGWVGESGPVLDEHGELLEKVTTLLDQDLAVLVELRRDVNVVLKEMPRQPKFPPICWPRLTADQAEDVWRELGEWVGDVLVDRWFVDRAHLPDCWAMHPGAVEALTWAWRAWLHAMMRTAGAVSSAEWHTRWRKDALKDAAEAVLQEAVATRSEKCGPGTHLGRPLPGSPGAPQAPQTAATGQSEPAAWDTGAEAPWSVPRGPSREMEIGRDPASDLAEREFWWPHLQAAAAADVARRAAEKTAKSAPDDAAGEDGPTG